MSWPGTCDVAGVSSHDMLNCTKYISIRSNTDLFCICAFFAFCHLNMFSKSSDPVNAQSLIMTQKLTLFRGIILLRVRLLLQLNSDNETQAQTITMLTQAVMNF